MAKTKSEILTYIRSSKGGSLYEFNLSKRTRSWYYKGDYTLEEFVEKYTVPEFIIEDGFNWNRSTCDHPNKYRFWRDVSKHYRKWYEK